MSDTTVDPNAVIELQAQEIARLVHRAIVAEVAVAQLRGERDTLLSMVRQGLPEETVDIGNHNDEGDSDA